MNGAGPLRRAAAVWLVLFAAYAATLSVDAFGTSDYGGDEPHYLLAAESIASDRDVDLTDEYAARDYAPFYPYALDPHGSLTGGRRHEPHGIGFPLLIAPAYALGGAKAVELFLAALAALAFALAVPLARRVVPDPWATRAVVVTGLSPPALAYGATVYPELVAGGVLVAAALLALRVRDSARMRDAYGCAALLATLPWLGTKYAIPGALVAIALVRWTARRGRRVGAIFAAEVIGASLVVYGSVNSALYGGLTPYAADLPGETATDAAFPAGYVERLPRLAALWLDRDYGLLRWAPFAALAFFGAFLLWRSVGDRLSRALPERRDAEAAAAVALAICAGALVVAAFGSPTMFGFWFPPRHLVVALPAGAALAAWGLRRAPRTGLILAGLTLVTSAWLAVDLLTGHADGWVHPSGDAPLGPAIDLLPLYGVGSRWADAVAVALAVAAAGLVAFEWRRWSRNRRQTAGTTRRAYSP